MDFLADRLDHRIDCFLPILFFLPLAEKEFYIIEIAFIKKHPQDSRLADAFFYALKFKAIYFPFESTAHRHIARYFGCRFTEFAQTRPRHL